MVKLPTILAPINSDSSSTSNSNSNSNSISNSNSNSNSNNGGSSSINKTTTASGNAVSSNSNISSSSSNQGEAFTTGFMLPVLSQPSLSTEEAGFNSDSVRYSTSPAIISENFKLAGNQLMVTKQFKEAATMYSQVKRHRKGEISAVRVDVREVVYTRAVNYRLHYTRVLAKE